MLLDLCWGAFTPVLLSCGRPVELPFGHKDPNRMLKLKRMMKMDDKSQNQSETVGKTVEKRMKTDEITLIPL